MSEGFLQQLGAAISAVLIVLLLLITAVVCVIIWFYKAKIKKFNAKARIYGLHWLPPRLHLSHESLEKNADRTNKRVESLLSLGFQETGRFIATNYESLKLVTLMHPGSGCAAVVYYCEGLGTWSDLFFLTVQDEWISASNVKKRLHFLHLPGDRKFHEPNKSEAELYEMVLRSRENSAVELLNSEKIASAYEMAFARRADNRLLEPTEDYELRQLLRESEITSCDPEAVEVSEQEFRQMKEARIEWTNQQIAAACALDFMRSGNVSGSEWRRSRNRLLVVHDRTPLANLVKRQGGERHVTKKLKPYLKSKAAMGQPREAFVRINPMLPPADRYQKLGSLEKPVPCDIYRAPLAGFST